MANFVSLQRLTFLCAIIAPLTLSGCHGINPSELDLTRQRPSKADLVGQWVPTSASLKDMKERGGYRISKHELDLHTDGSFLVINMPDWWDSIRDESRRGFESGSGTWGIHGRDGRAVWVVDLYFTDRHLVSLNLRHQKPLYLLQIMLGDPDNTDYVMLLEKATDR
jgi:hypothetical protein